jgi:hypothetical protein
MIYSFQVKNIEHPQSFSKNVQTYKPQNRSGYGIVFLEVQCNAANPISGN